ncbi:MAG: LysR family transcriptional regulator, partial [Novosphingobium sp.]|nr:LysR family transcriptional regulator [Novosphingobium sp.]
MIDLAHGPHPFLMNLQLPAPRTICKQDEKMRGIPAMMQVPDWNDYQAFLAIARAGQLARAAQAI